MYTEKEMAYWLDRIDGLGKKRLQKLREVLGENTEDTQPGSMKWTRHRSGNFSRNVLAKTIKMKE